MSQQIDRRTLDTLILSVFLLVLLFGLYKSCNRSHTPINPAKKEYKKGAEIVKNTPHKKEGTFNTKPIVVYKDTGSVIHDTVPNKIDTLAVLKAYLQLDSIRVYADTLIDSSAMAVSKTWVKGERLRQDLKMYWRERERSRVDTLFIYQNPIPPKFGHMFVGVGGIVSPEITSAHGSASFLSRNERILYSVQYAPQIPLIQKSYIGGDVKWKIW